MSDDNNKEKLDYNYNFINSDNENFEINTDININIMQSKEYKLENFKDLFRKTQIKNVKNDEENDKYFKIIE